MDLLAEFADTVEANSGAAAATLSQEAVHPEERVTGSDSRTNTGAGRFVVQDLNPISRVTADEDEEMMELENEEETGFGNNVPGNLMDEEDEAMQFESVANKMFQTETEVVPLPTVDHTQLQEPRVLQTTSHTISNNSHQINSGQ